jgi:2-dehydro-3-deoxygluconokinase
MATMTGTDARSGLDVFTAGEAMALLLADGFQPLRRADRFIRGVAGSESNVAVGLARLGHRVAFGGRVGADPVGGWVRDALQAEGIDIHSLITDPSLPTGLLLRDSPRARPVSVSYYRSGSAGAALGPADVPADVIKGARAVFLSGITPMLSRGAAQFTDQVLRVAGAAGVPVFFDPNVRLRLADRETWRAMRTYLDRIDTLLVGHEELALLGLPDDPAELLSPRLRTVVVKRGAEGATVTTADETRYEPANSVPLVDPVGAGDAFCAGWISASLRGLPLAESLREANAVASFVVATATDLAGLPTGEERTWAIQRDRTDVDR